MLTAGANMGGDLDVVIAVLDDPGRVADAVSFIDSTDRELGHVVLATAVTFETLNDNHPTARASRDEAGAKLSEAARLLPDLDPAMVLLPGRASRALSDYVTENGIDTVVAVGEPAPQAAIQRQGANWEHAIVVTTRPFDRSVGNR